SRPGNGFPPASSTSTFFPAAVSTCATDPPPAPLPMIQKSKRVRLRFPRTSSDRVMAGRSLRKESREPDDGVLDPLPVGRERERNDRCAVGSKLVGVRRRHGVPLPLDVVIPGR